MILEHLHLIGILSSSLFLCDFGLNVLVSVIGFYQIEVISERLHTVQIVGVGGIDHLARWKIHNKNISAYDIAEVSFEVDSTNYVTDEAHLPADSKVVGNTWLNVNSDGSPDRRYKHNMPCLICEFGKLRISSDTGLDVLFLLSNADNVEQFKSILPQ